MDLTPIPHNKLRPSQLNPRKRFDEAALDELAASIRDKGLLQNVTARPKPNTSTLFEIAAGERRWRAIGRAIEQGWLPDTYAVPTRVLELTDAELLDLALAENVGRSDLSPLEEADAYARLITLGRSIDEIATRSGYSLATVERRLALATKLIPQARDMVDAGTLGVSAAVVLAAVDADAQAAALDAMGHWHRVDADTVRRWLKHRAFPVSLARFDLSLYRGEITNDLFGGDEPLLLDREQAMRLQLAEADRLEVELSSAWSFVDRAEYYSFGEYRRPDEVDPAEQGALITLDASGRLETHTGLERRSRTPAATSEPPEFSQAHLDNIASIQAAAMAEALMRQPERVLPVAVAALLPGALYVSRLEGGRGNARLPLPASVRAAHTAALEALGVTVVRDDAHGRERWIEPHLPTGAALVEQLAAIDRGVLERLFAALVADSLTVSRYNGARDGMGDHAGRLAAWLGADPLTVWQVDREYLKRRSIAGLEQLASLLGLDVRGMKKSGMVTALLEHPDLARLVPAEVAMYARPEDRPADRLMLHPEPEVLDNGEA